MPGQRSIAGSRWAPLLPYRVYLQVKYTLMGLRKLEPAATHPAAKGTPKTGLLYPESGKCSLNSWYRPRGWPATFGVRLALDKPKLAFSSLRAASRIGRIRHPRDGSRVLMLALSGSDVYYLTAGADFSPRMHANRHE